MSHQRADDWFRRSKFPSSAHAGLGWGVEYWDPDHTHYEGWLELRDHCVALGRTETNGRDLTHLLSRNRLDDVLAAAGGVEHAIGALRSAVDDLGRWVAEHDLRADEHAPVRLAHGAASEAWYAFADVITWARTFEERIERQHVQKGFRKQGLLPAIIRIRGTDADVLQVSYDIREFDDLIAHSRHVARQKGRRRHVGEVPAAQWIAQATEHVVRPDLSTVLTAIGVGVGFQRIVW